MDSLPDKRSGRACGTYGGQKKYMQIFVGVT
jgi:hypothetical protein